MITTLPSASRLPALFPTTLQGAGSGAELVTSDGRALPLEATTLHAEVQGGLARFVLEQRYRNSYDETLHVVYRMPLPADGAVSGYAFEIGGRVIKGVVDRKRAARERYEQAIVSGHTAALLEQERADIFTQKLGNIPGGETILAKITVDARLAWLPEGEWELRFPTVIGPRYCGSAETADDVRATHLKVTAEPLRVTVQLALTIKDAITGGKKPTSPTHALEHRDGSIALAAGARLDRDLVVRWPTAAPEVGLSLALARPTDGDAYGLVTIVPPAREANRTAVARDLIVLLDTSGSMEGVPLTKAKQVVSMVIDSLAEHDRFELIEFSDSPTRYKREPLQASAKAKQDAIQWVRSRKASGGTEMRRGVLEALQTLRVGAQRQVIIVTDGYVGGEQQILQTLLDHLPRSCRLHVLGVGDAVNRSLATQLSRAGRGVEVLVGDRDDAERGAKRLLDRTRAPMLVNVEIAGTALLRHAPEQMPDVFAGAPVVAGLVLRPEGGELIVRGELADGPWVQTIRVAAQQPGEGNAAIPALYARELIADLESRSMIESVDGRVEELGLAYSIATRMTSWIAVDESRVVPRGSSREVVVPQEIPHGTNAQAFGLRPGSAPLGMLQAQMAPSFAEVDALSVGRGAMALDDEEGEGGAPFDAEEPTGARDRSVNYARRSEVSAPRGRPSPGPRAPMAPMAPPPASRPKVSAGSAPEPEEKSVEMKKEASLELRTATKQAPEAPAPIEERNESELVARRVIKPAPMELQAVTPERAKGTGWFAWFMLLLVLAVIAALIWWLVL